MLFDALKMMVINSVIGVILVEFINCEIFSNEKINECEYNFEFIKSITVQSDYLSIVEIVEDVDTSIPTELFSMFLEYLNEGEGINLFNNNTDIT